MRTWLWVGVIAFLIIWALTPAAADLYRRVTYAVVAIALGAPIVRSLIWTHRRNKA